jgi:hypothetical protein
MFCIESPAAVAIGWIPFFRRIGSTPSGGMKRYARRGWRENAACHLLLVTGNARPIADFHRFAELRGYLRAKDYRGAVCLRNLRVFFHDHGVAYHALCRGLPEYLETGFTPQPVRLFGLEWLLAALPSRLSSWRFMKGKGQRIRRIEVSPVGDEVRFSYEVRFRIGWLGNVFAKILTRNWVAYAWMRIEYAVRSNGQVNVAFAGSQMPSQGYYVNWTMRGEYDMLLVDEPGVHACFTAGRDRLMPRNPGFQWNGSGRSR